MSLSFTIGTLLLLATTASAIYRAKHFEAITSPGGMALCAVDQPTETELMPLGGSLIECGIKCLTAPGCIIYNFNDVMGQCDRYWYIPVNYLPQANCTGWSVVCELCIIYIDRNPRLNDCITRLFCRLTTEAGAFI